MDGWMIGVLIEQADEPAPVRHFYAVAQADRARAEWAAADRAMTAGAIATSPVAGMEPVDALGALSGRAMDLLGLKPGEVRALGRRWPRRWMSPEPVNDEEPKG
jgi:hypothetical protein